MTEPLVEVRARTRFMVYGQTPAQAPDIEVWILRVPPSWVEGVAPGASSQKLTERCHRAVSTVNERWRTEAIASAQASLAAGGEYDAGHHVLEATSVRLLFPWELHRRPWTEGHHHFFYVVDEGGGLRKGAEADAPPMVLLTPFEEHAFAGWRAEQVGLWKYAAASYAAALRLADPDSEPALVGEVGAGLVQANGKIQRIDKAAAGARGALALGVPEEWQDKIHARLAEAYLASDRKPEGAESVGAAAAEPPPSTADYSAPGPRQANYGFRLMQRSNFQGAIEALHDALDEELPATGLLGRASTLFNLALALEHEGRVEEAQAHLRSALALQLQQGASGAGDAFDTELALARVLGRAGPAHATESRALLDRTASRVKAGSGSQGLHLWAAALLDHSVNGDTERTLAGIDRAAAMITYAAYARWIAEDRAKLSSGSG